MSSLSSPSTLYWDSICWIFFNHNSWMRFAILDLSVVLAQRSFGSMYAMTSEIVLNSINVMYILPCFWYFWQVSAACELVPSIPQVYRLVSVVEHFGRACGGHYTVYRSLQSESHEEHPDENCKPSLMHWFCISDSNVYRVSEEDVLAAEASLLFYERIVESWQRTNHTCSFWSCMSLHKQIFQSQSHVRMSWNQMYADSHFRFNKAW